MQMPTAKAQAKVDFSRIWPFGRGCRRVDHSRDLDSLYLAVGLVLDRLFEYRVFVTNQMMAEIKSGCRLFLGDEATDEMILECLGPYWNGHLMTYGDAEDLWELIEKDIEAWPDNHTYGPAWMHAEGHNTSEIGPGVPVRWEWDRFEAAKIGPKAPSGRGGTGDGGCLPPLIQDLSITGFWQPTGATFCRNPRRQPFHGVFVCRRFTVRNGERSTFVPKTGLSCQAQD